MTNEIKENHTADFSEKVQELRNLYTIKIFELEKQVQELREENKKLKKRKRYGLVWEDEKYKEKVVEDRKPQEER